MIAKSHQCQLTALATAVVLSLWGVPALALSLGRITVQSALGEPLKAEVEVLDINAEEAASLSTRVASPDAFKQAGLEYNPALGNLKTSLQRRPNGRAFLQLSSDRPVNDPFVDMILEANWNSGRIVRDYTLLFDPPSMKAPATSAPVATQLPLQAAPVAAPAAAAPQVSARVAPASRPEKVAPKIAKPVAEAPAPAAARKATGDATLTVKPGQTAGAIAATHKPASISLDQMLVALLRANPDAFIQDNVNRIKAGAVVTIPSEEQASATPRAEAQQIILAQSQDFNEFRRKLAGNAPTTQVAPASRGVSGTVQATVTDKKPAAGTPDKLTLSKGAIQAKSSEDQLAQARNTQEANARAAELSKNIAELSNIASAASATPPATAVSVSATAASTPTTPAVNIQEAASAPVAVAVLPKAPASAPKVIEPVAEPGFLDTLFENPLLPVGGAALIALLAGLGIYKVRQRKPSHPMESSFGDSSLSDAFSGNSGGQSVDTSDSLTTGSSMVYSPSQLDAVDDVDPVAEADVYLAYGRDLQAEEILKDALRSNPQRVAIHLKLLDIYAKRGDAKAFEAIAALAFNLTDGTGPEWEKVCEKGLTIDPDNALYLPGGQPVSDFAGLDAAPATVDMPLERPEASDTIPAPQLVAPVPSELDLDLDFSLDDVSPSQTPEPEAMPLDLPPIAPDPLAATLPQLPEISAEVQEQVDAAVAIESETQRGALDDSLDFLNSSPIPFETDDKPTQPLSLTDPETPATKPASDSHLMSFDLDSLSLDLGEDRATVPADLEEAPMNPLETKLALADEFRAIGDDDGARALIEEVIAEASGDTKAKAQQALNKL